jgi:hypothetical protein
MFETGESVPVQKVFDAKQISSLTLVSDETPTEGTEKSSK